MADPFYSTVPEAKRYSGVNPGTIGLDRDDAAGLDEQLVAWLVDAKGLIDSYTRRDFHEELAAGKITEIPRGVHNVAMRIVANTIAQAQMRRNSPLVQVDEYRQRVVDDTVMTRSIRQDLDPYVAKSSSQPRFMRVRGKTERSEMAS